MKAPEPIGFIGAGALAGFLADGLLAAGWPPAALWMCNRGDDARLLRFAGAGVHVTRAKAEVCGRAAMLLILVKPKDAPATLAELAPLLRPEHLVVSCMAGIPAAFIEAGLGGRPRVLRAMPNIGSAARASVTGLAPGRYADAADVDRATGVLQAVGMVAPVQESAMDAFTAVCGSGPAYVFLLMEALAAVAADLGLRGPLAQRMIVQTVLGAAQVAAASERPPEELRAGVSSRGGTTMAAVEVLEAAGFRQALGEAVRRAAARSRELGLAWASLPPESGVEGARP